LTAADGGTMGQNEAAFNSVKIAQLRNGGV
jgi:hypothetical protein